MHQAKQNAVFKCLSVCLHAPDIKCQIADVNFRLLLTHRCTEDQLIACWVCECCDWCVGSVSWRPVPVCQHGPLYHSTIYLWRLLRLYRHVWRTELRRLHTAAQYVRLDCHRRRHVALLYIQPVNSNRPVNGYLHHSKVQSLLLLLTNYFNTTKSFICIDFLTCDLVVLKLLITTNLIKLITENTLS